jgi:hypothetical protein
LREEAKPQKYSPGGNLIAWEIELLRNFAADAFDSIILHIPVQASEGVRRRPGDNPGGGEEDFG